MPLWKLTLAYDGTPYRGWQVQPGLPTVQGTLAAAIRRVTGETVLPQGSGRTDTGVHALGQVASFTLDAPIPPATLLRALNRALPASIRVMKAEYAPCYTPDRPFHARHSALRKTYEYRIFPRIPQPLDEARATADERLEEAVEQLKEAEELLEHLEQLEQREPPDLICPPTLAPYVWDCPWPVNLSRAREAAAHILGEHDFTSFAAVDPDLSQRLAGESPGSLRQIVASSWHAEGSVLLYRVTGSGFLHHMVRNLVGTFVEVASGRLEPSAIPAILNARDRSRAGQTAPASGLFLLSVDYPEPMRVQPHSTAGACL